MFFRVDASMIGIQRANFYILRRANLAVALYKITPAHKQLNSYLWKEFGLNIKTASVMIVAKSRIQKNRNNELIVTFPSKEIDRMAAIITYGTGKIPGCTILQEAFGRH